MAAIRGATVLTTLKPPFTAWGRGSDDEDLEEEGEEEALAI